MLPIIPDDVHKIHFSTNCVATEVDVLICYDVIPTVDGIAA